MSASYDDILEKITAPTLTTENWDGILTFCDKINADIEGAKTGLKALRKRLNNRDPHVVLMAVSVLDSCWSNCGDKFRKEVSSSQFIDELKALCTNSQRLVAQKTRVSVQKWVDNECKNEPSLSLIVSLHRTLLEDGYSFTVDDPKKKGVDAKLANNPDYVSSAQEEDEIAKAIAASLADAEKQEKLKKTTSTLYPSASKSASQTSNERKVRALYDYHTDDEDGLELTKGEIVSNVHEINPHWWTGQIGTQQGLFPSSFVTNDLDVSKAKQTSDSVRAPEVEAQINEAILVKCVNVLHECDPTGERPELAQLEAASYTQGPLIDAQLTNISPLYQVSASKINNSKKLCEVCGQISNGIRFGVFACDNCARFFSKNYFKKDTVECSFENQCESYIDCISCKLIAAYACGMSAPPSKPPKDIVSEVIMMKKPNVKWSHVAGLVEAKAVLYEAVVRPIKFPLLFTGNRKRWQGILLFGPPGTGKSYIAEAVATEADNSTFFSISSSDLMSKWLGESEKLVKSLFELARALKPSVIFIDEIDAIGWKRADKERKIVDKFILEIEVQLKNVEENKEKIFVLGASNKPWKLDEHTQRLFTSLYIPLPDVDARKEMFRIDVGKNRNNLSDQDYKFLAERTEGYSGYDISILVKDALMQPIRRVQSATHFKHVSGPSPRDPNVIVHDLLSPCSPGDPHAIAMGWLDVPSEKLADPVLSMQDLNRSLSSVKPTVNSTDLDRLEQFKNDFGQVGQK